MPVPLALRFGRLAVATPSGDVLEALALALTLTPAGVTKKVQTPDWPPRLLTWMLCGPALVSSDAGISALSCEAERAMVLRLVEPKTAVDGERKFRPLIVTVIGLPA